MDVALVIIAAFAGLAVFCALAFCIVSIIGAVQFIERQQREERQEALEATYTDWSQFEIPDRKPTIDPVKGMIP